MAATPPEPARADVDVIGRWVTPGPLPQGWGPGDPMPEPTLSAGWRVNVTPALLDADLRLIPFVITPTRLRQVWAGDDPANAVRTVALRFADEAEAQSLLGG